MSQTYTLVPSSHCLQQSGVISFAILGLPGKWHTTWKWGLPTLFLQINSSLISHRRHSEIYTTKQARWWFWSLTFGQAPPGMILLLKDFFLFCCLISCFSFFPFVSFLLLKQLLSCQVSSPVQSICKNSLVKYIWKSKNKLTVVAASCLFVNKAVLIHLSWLSYPHHDGLICIQYDEFLTTRLHLFYNPSSVFDTLRFAFVFIQAPSQVIM